VLYRVVFNYLKRIVEVFNAVLIAFLSTALSLSGENIVCDPFAPIQVTPQINIAANHPSQYVEVVFCYKLLFFRLLHVSNLDWQIGVLQSGAPVLGKLVKRGFGDRIFHLE
jgi:hypothetical protein